MNPSQKRIDEAAESLLGEVLTTTDYIIHKTQLSPTGRKWEAQFEVNNVSFSFYAYVIDESIGSWDIMFRDDVRGYGRTKKGGQFKVFAAVMEVLKRFEREVKPNIVRFDAADKSRIRLYDHLIRWFMAEFNFKIADEHGDPNYKYYTLERIGYEPPEEDGNNQL